MTRRVIVALVAVAVIFAAIFLAFMFFGGRTKTISSVVQKYEFTEIVPPSTLAQPGSIVAVIKDDPLVVGVICPASEALGPDVHAKLLTSDSATSKQIAELTGEFKLDGSILESITADIKTKFIKNITVTLSNVKIIEIPDSVVFDLIANRKVGCSNAIQFRRDQGMKISMVKSVIQATAVYRVQFGGNLNADARAKATREIAGTLGLTNGVKSDDTIQGEGLIWGIRDDVSLGTLTATSPPVTGSGERPRALPANKVAKVVSDAQ